jgi:hypothetical protein
MSNDDKEIELGVISHPEGETNGASGASKCSFCGKTAAQVTYLLAGSDALICDACIARYKADLKENI